MGVDGQGGRAVVVLDRGAAYLATLQAVVLHLLCVYCDDGDIHDGGGAVRVADPRMELGAGDPAFARRWVPYSCAGMQSTLFV